MIGKRKRIKAGAALLAVVLLAGCSGIDKRGEENRQTVSDLKTAQRLESPETGLVFSISEEYQNKGVVIEEPYQNGKGYKSARISFYYKPVTDALFEELMALPQEEWTEEVQLNFYENMAVHMKCLMELTLIEEQEYKDAKADGKKPSDLAYWENAAEFGTNDGYVYLLAIPENSTEGMSEEEKTQYEECHAYMQTVKETLVFTKIEKAEGMPSQIPAFTAEDLQGNEVTESIFSGKDLTVLNIWGTFCTPCIEEMPELGEWAKTVSDNVQLVGLVSDISGEEDKDLAVAIMEKAGADFTQIIANEDWTPVLKYIVGVPTTLFIDKDGNVVGEPIVGADVDGYKKFVEDYFREQ